MRVLGLTALATLAADQATKLLVIFGLDLPHRGEIDVIDPLLNFRWAENRGINFGLLNSGTEVTRWLLIALALGRLFGARTLWVDSIANSERLSGSGEIARRFAHQVITQWPDLAHGNDPAYWGSVL